MPTAVSRKQKSIQHYFGNKVNNTDSEKKAEKDSSNTTDVEEGEPCLTSSPREKSKTLKYPPAVTRIINYVSSLTLVELNKCLAAVVTFLFVLIIMAPAHVRKRRNVVLAKQYAEATASLNQKYVYLQKTLNGENDRLIDDMYEMAGLVKLDRHDEELKARDSTIDTMSMDSKAEKLKKQIEIDKVKAEIAKHQLELEKVKALMDDLDVKPENFCDVCITDLGIGCKARRGYFQNHYKLPLTEAINVIVRQSPSCFKKDSNSQDLLSEIAGVAEDEQVLASNGEALCGDCIFHMKGLENTTCRKRVEYLQDKYGTLLQEAIDGVVNSNLECSKRYDETICGDCLMEGFYGSTCRQRLDYLHDKHGITLQEAMDSVVNADPGCSKKN